MSDDGYASPVVGGSGALIRDWIQSRNYVPGLSGWQIAADGSAEFVGITARGTVIVGNPPDSALKLFVDAANNDRATMDLYSGDPSETAPGALIAQPNVGGGIATFLYSPQDTNGGATGLKLLAENATQRPQVEFFANAPNPSGLPLLAKVFGDLQVTGTYQPGGIAQFDSLHSDGDITCDTGIYGNFVEGDTGVQAGLASGLHTSLSVNQLQAWNGGAASTLFLNSSGAAVFVGGSELRVDSGLIQTSVSTETTGTAANTTMVNVAGTIWRVRRFTSTRRHKENIRDLDVSAETILALRPRTFQRNDHRDYTDPDEPILPVTEATPWDVGFIAEEAEDLGLAAWVQRDAEGEVEGFAYATFVAAQQIVLREQQRLIDDLAERLAELERRPSAG